MLYFSMLIDFESKFCQHKVDVNLVKLLLNDLVKLEHLSEHQFIYCRILLP